jgi:hypothetical protein
VNKPFLTVVAVPMGFGDSTKELSTGNTKKGNRKEMETKQPSSGSDRSSRRHRERGTGNQEKDMI